uniref:Uncharacterized protein n=1 Tax=Glossina pallidipes TaxID=7398 RepID=A0A1A9ZN92_GLOPL
MANNGNHNISTSGQLWLCDGQLFEGLVHGWLNDSHFIFIVVDIALYGYGCFMFYLWVREERVVAASTLPHIMYRRCLFIYEFITQSDSLKNNNNIKCCTANNNINNKQQTVAKAEHNNNNTHCNNIGLTTCSYCAVGQNEIPNAARKKADTALSLNIVKANETWEAPQTATINSRRLVSKPELNKHITKTFQIN